MSYREPASFDWRALVGPVDPHAVREVMARYQGKRGSGLSPLTKLMVVGTIVTLVGVGVVIGVVSAIVSSTASSTASNDALLTVVTTVVVGVIVVGLVALFTMMVRRQAKKRHERWYRLTTFAEANGMSFLPFIWQPPLPGVVFEMAKNNHTAASHDVVRAQSPRFIETGNYQYTVGSGKSQTTYRWGYAAIKVDNLLPNIVLDAHSNNNLFGSNLGTFRRGQKLSLEGNFDQYFSLYCPHGYERDALYLFTPDIMQRLIEHASVVDIELVDNWVMFYSNRDLSTLDPAMWNWLFTTVRVVLDKIAQWERWRDDRGVTAPALRPAVTQMPALVVPGASAFGAAGAAPAAGGSAGVAYRRPLPGVAVEGRRLSRKRLSGGAIATLISLAVVIVVTPVVTIIVIAVTSVFGNN